MRLKLMIHTVAQVAPALCITCLADAPTRDYAPFRPGSPQVNSIRRPLLAVLGIIVFVALGLVVEIARVGGLFRLVDEQTAGGCTPIPLGGSAEDVQIDRERGLAYLSVLDRAAVARREPVVGSIMLLDLNLAEPAPRAALAFDPPGFRPHGISWWRRSGEAARLFAISHPPDGGHTVEILEQDTSGAFFPRQSVRDPLFVHPNALVAVGPRQFYLANDEQRDAAGHAIDALLRRGKSTVVYFDGQQARVVARDLRFAAGIAVSPDGSQLYVGEAMGNQLRVYRRNVETGDLALQEIVALGAAPDNLNVDAHGVVWMAAHPKLFAFLEHLEDPASRAPTQVLRLQPAADAAAGKTRLTTVYSSKGAPLSAGSVAASWKDEFVLGAVLDHQVLICKNRT
jgi:arylesterase/paraoxonase